ncbi:helix-turn-helix domain-containing protein [Streptomyces sp. NPDC102364]|uniref:helix-turn-helix domain-containing protein n=1 Tax=unclassified Streptomyces TaxID=2593676 RepID=UPI002E194908
MRYPQGGGLTAERRAFREDIRLEAAGLFAAGAGNAEVAKRLRVSVRSVQRWHRAWQDRGDVSLQSAGSAAASPGPSTATCSPVHTSRSAPRWSSSGTI